MVSVVLLLVVPGADPVVVNNCRPVVVNKAAPCPCGHRCGCGSCGCGLIKGEAVPALMSYADLYAHVSRGGSGQLMVGNNVRTTPLHVDPHAIVPSGFGGLADGLYSCYAEGGRPVMKALAVTGPAPTTFIRVCGPTGCQLVPAR